MNSINIALSGADGRMGKTLSRQFMLDKDFKIVLAFDAEEEDNLSLDSYIIDILIDFTIAESAHRLIPKFLKKGIPVVSGTTSQNLWFDEYELLVKETKTPLAVIPNFSLGAMLLEEFGIIASKYFSNVELVEYHHSTKVDKPSGTAKKMAKSLNINEKSIHSIRLPGFLAHHELIFGKSGETLSLRHDTSGRDCYYWGIKKTINKLIEDKTPKFYKDLKDIIRG